MKKLYHSLMLNHRTRPRFGVDHSGKGKSSTSDTELLRGTLAKILYDGTEEKAQYIFGDYITSVDKSDSKIQSSPSIPRSNENSTSSPQATRVGRMVGVREGEGEEEDGR